LDKLLELSRKSRPIVVAIDTEQFYAVSGAQSHLAPVSPDRRFVGFRAAEELDWLGMLLALVLNGNTGCRDEDVEMLLAKPGGAGMRKRLKIWKERLDTIEQVCLSYPAFADMWDAPLVAGCVLAGACHRPDELGEVGDQ